MGIYLGKNYKLAWLLAIHWQSLALNFRPKFQLVGCHVFLKHVFEISST